MSRKSDYTLILVTDKFVWRSDYVGSPPTRVTDPPPLERNVDSRLVDDVRRVLDNQPPPGRRVAILATSVWNQLVSIPRPSIDSIDREQLGEALKYEVEPLAGIDADIATLGFVEVNGTTEFRRFWVNVASRDQWDSVREFLLSRKAREVVLAHPVSLSSPTGLQRLEFWNNSVFMLDEQGNLQQTNVVTAGSTRWIADLGLDSPDSLLRKSNVLIATPQESLSETLAECESLVDLSIEAHLEQWLSQAASRFANTGWEQLPLIRQEHTSHVARRNWLVKAVALIMVTGFCGWHLSWMISRNHHVVQETRKLERPGIEKQKYDVMLQEVIQKRDFSISQSIATKTELQKVRFFFENQTDRLHTLLRKLVELRTSELVIKEIQTNDRGTVISGVSLDSDAAPLLTNRLRDAVSSVGWEIHPASQKGQLKMTSGGPWTFSILLEDAGPPSLISEPRKNTAGINRMEHQVRQ